MTLVSAAEKWGGIQKQDTFTSRNCLQEFFVLTTLVIGVVMQSKQRINFDFRQLKLLKINSNSILKPQF